MYSYVVHVFVPENTMYLALIVRVCERIESITDLLSAAAAAAPCMDKLPVFMRLLSLFPFMLRRNLVEAAFCFRSSLGVTLEQAYDSDRHRCVCDGRKPGLPTKSSGDYSGYRGRTLGFGGLDGSREIPSKDSAGRSMSTGSSSFAAGCGPASSPDAQPHGAGQENGPPALRVLLNGGDNMLGRAVQLTCVHQSRGDDAITDSMPALHYMQLSLHPGDDADKDLNLEAIRELNRHGGYLWRDYEHLIIQPPPHLRILNLETAVTTSIDKPDVPREKLRYHFHERNLGPVLSAYQRVTHESSVPISSGNGSGTGSSPVAVTFANNHCFDMGKTAFVEETLPRFHSISAESSSSIQFVGAGRNRSDAMRPLTYPLDPSSSIVVFAVGSSDSGIPPSWAATVSSAGVFWIPDLTSKARVSEAFRALREAITKYSTDKDIVILSIHWGPNWAYRHYLDSIEQEHRQQLARRLIDECGVDLIYGHSSHHIRGMEVYNGKCILYGTGDLINDYEGFSNPCEEAYNTFGGIFLADLCRVSGKLLDLHIVPTFMNRLQLRRWTPSSKVWNPNKGVMEPAPNGAIELCEFVNGMTSRDASSKSTALKLCVCEKSSAVPGGPVLRWDKGASGGASTL